MSPLSDTISCDRSALIEIRAAPRCGSPRIFVFDAHDCVRRKSEDQVFAGERSSGRIVLMFWRLQETSPTRLHALR